MEIRAVCPEQRQLDKSPNGVQTQVVLGANDSAQTDRLVRPMKRCRICRDWAVRGRGSHNNSINKLKAERFIFKKG